MSGKYMGWVQNGRRGMERKQRKPWLRVALEMEHETYLWAYWPPK